jgi:hypothetical protein
MAIVETMETMVIVVVMEIMGIVGIIIATWSHSIFFKFLFFAEKRKSRRCPAGDAPQAMPPAGDAPRRRCPAGDAPQAMPRRQKKIPLAGLPGVKFETC